MSETVKEKKKWGLGSASPEIRSRVARAGGIAAHDKRDLQAADHDTKIRVAREGGLARGAQRKKQKEQKRLAQGTFLKS